MAGLEYRELVHSIRWLLILIGLLYGDQTFVKIYLFAYSVDKAIVPTCRAPGWGLLLVDHGAGPPWQPLRQRPL